MPMTDLQGILTHWESKYPEIMINLYADEFNGGFFGKIMTNNANFDLQADTIGELINQGDSFLREIK